MTDRPVSTTSPRSPSQDKSPGKATLLRSGAAYTLASAIPRAVGFLLLPIFTRILSPADYGQLSVALSVTAVASILFALGFEVAVFRGLFQLEGDAEGRSALVRNLWTFLIPAPLAMAAVCWVVVAPILGTSNVLSPGRLALSLLGAAILVSATTVPLAALRADNRVRDYMILNGLITVTSTVLTLALVAWLRVGVDGWLVALIVANTLGLVVAMRVVPYGGPRHFDFTAVKKTLPLSISVVPHFAALWALQLADRVLVATLLTLSAAGVYSLASNLALPMYMIVLGFGQAFMPDYAQAGQENQPQGALRRTIAMQVGVVAALCVACALIGPPLVHLLNDRYAGAAPLVPWLVLGYGFLGLYAIPMNGITLTHGRTNGLIVVSSAGAATNIGLIVTLGPVYGVEAVAIASAVGYAVLLLAVVVFSRYRHAMLEYPWARICAAIALAAAGYAGGVLSSSDDALAATVTIRMTWIVATTAGVLGVSLASRDRVQQAKSRFRHNAGRAEAP